ncbi:hypothetical protein ABB37_01420 [Leptomonas pyrrhocoris]|uniref:Uncharacterized protein n=1 Tax=Leptomonas pyrrhocoris TaxID=157538 RepID=A0A0N0VHF8_LEPPY|nr:hypothetical protein ABB37_01420 [Leptomonas pyrrhocoris]KPA84984.1 hypothetical protein ABB37_01420 [Leptomonas pyrrhocoris]|eukprot:XP_015663423.1 hypothetical protein ABB37_01420 [Leptomonas pyrrhocoris]
MEESMAVQLHALREEQHRLEQLLGHTALGTSFEAANILHGHAQVSAQRRCAQELSVQGTDTADVNSTVIPPNDPTATVANSAAAQVLGRAQWSYQDRLAELESLKKKYEEYARASMSQYFNSVGDYQGYKERRESRMKHVQPFAFESRELMKPQRIREQRAEDDRRSREAALEERRRNPLKAKPVPPSTFMNKYALMVEEWCQRKAAIELMSRERARLAKEEAEYVRLSAQSLRKTREELMGVVYGPDGKPVTKREQQRRRAQSADARSGCAVHHVHAVPLEVKMKLWPALSDHERVRRERLKYKAAVRKVEVDEEVRQVLPLLTSPTPRRCYDAAAGVNEALLLLAAGGGVGVGGGPCYGIGQAIHPANAAATTAAEVQGVVPAVPPPTAATTAGTAPSASPLGLPPSSTAANSASLMAPPPAAPVPAPVPLPPPGVSVPLPPPQLPAVPAPTPIPTPVPRLPPGAVAPLSLGPHQSFSLLSSSNVVATPLGLGGGGAASAVPAVPPPQQPPATAATVGAGAWSPSSASPMISIVPSSLASPAFPVPQEAIATLPPPTAAPPSPSASMRTQIHESATSTMAMSKSPPASTATAPPNSIPPLPPPSLPPSGAPLALQTSAVATSSTVAASPAAASAPAGAPGAIPPATATAAAATPPHNAQEGREAVWRRFNPQLTFKPHVKPGVPNFEALWAKNKAELAEKKKAHPTTTPRPFDLTRSAKAEKVVGRRPTRSVRSVGTPARQRPTSRAKKAPSTATATLSTDAAGAAAATNTAAQRGPSPPSHNATRQPRQSPSSAARGTRGHALRTEAIYSTYVKQSKDEDKVAEEDEQYWKAVAHRRREVRQRLAGYITDHHLEHELTIKSKVQALRASMKENEKAAEERLTEMKRRVAQMPPVFAEPVHLHEESKARAAVEQSILKSLQDTGLDGATIKTILAASASGAGSTETGDAAEATAGSPEEATAEQGAKPTTGDGADAPHSPASAQGKSSQKVSGKSSSTSSSDSSSSSSSSSDSSSSDSDSSSSSSPKRRSSVPPRSTSLSVSSAASVPVPKSVTPKRGAEYSDDSFEDSSDSD